MRKKFKITWTSPSDVVDCVYVECANMASCLVWLENHRPELSEWKKLTIIEVED
jgi:hypothetical protein